MNAMTHFNNIDIHRACFPRPQCQYDTSTIKKVERFNVPPIYTISVSLISYYLLFIIHFMYFYIKFETMFKNLSFVKDKMVVYLYVTLMIKVLSEYLHPKTPML